MVVFPKFVYNANIHTLSVNLKQKERDTMKRVLVMLALILPLAGCAIMAYVEAKLEECDWQVDYVFSHTVPIEYEPVWAFIQGIDQSLVDKTMEKWLQRIADNLEFEMWYAAHYHVECEEDGVRIMYEDYLELE